jgi:hypothetical protein
MPPTIRLREIDGAFIDDDAAVAFAAAFYEALGYGQSVQTAFDLALVRLAGAARNASSPNCISGAQSSRQTSCWWSCKLLVASEA